MRPVVLHPKARDEIRRFPKDVRDRIGRSLFQLQMGERLGMPRARPMPSVASGVSELRVHGRDGTYRVFFTPSDLGILVFHAFVKKTQDTPPHEILLARKRLEELLDA